jgi:hypothetical protein
LLGFARQWCRADGLEIISRLRVTRAPCSDLVLERITVAAWCAERMAWKISAALR